MNPKIEFIRNTVYLFTLLGSDYCVGDCYEKGSICFGHTIYDCRGAQPNRSIPSEHHLCVCLPTGMLFVVCLASERNDEDRGPAVIVRAIAEVKPTCLVRSLVVM